MPGTVAERTILDEKITAEIKELIRKTIREEFALYWLKTLPPVSDEEQAELEQILGSREELDKGEYVDATEWLEANR